MTLNYKCRTCLSQSNVCHQLTDYVDENCNIIDMLDGIVPQIDIRTSSKFSNLMCQSCVDKLLIGYKFQQLCIESNYRLYDLLGVTLFETAPEKLWNPLTGETNLHMKQEIEDDNSECETIPTDIERGLRLENGAEDRDTNLSDNLEKELFSKPKQTNNDIEFVDTSIGQVEKSKNSNKKGNYPCEKCGKEFHQPCSLRRHHLVHSLTRPYECDICKYRFDTANMLKIHLTQHENKTKRNYKSRPEGFKCSDCPRRFEKQASLSIHRIIHTRNSAESIYSCTICQRNFKTVKNLVQHIRIKHPEVEKHKCDQCDKTFVFHAHLVEHLNQHKEKTKPVCSICGKEFATNYHFKEHMRRHSGERPYQCPQCDKTFRHLNTFRGHIRTHSGESPFLCSQCGKTFRHSSNLAQHKERHTGLKKFQCPKCPSRFFCKSDLERHQRGKKIHSHLETDNEKAECKT